MIHGGFKHAFLHLLLRVSVCVVIAPVSTRAALLSPRMLTGLIWVPLCKTSKFLSGRSLFTIGTMTPFLIEK